MVTRRLKKSSINTKRTNKKSKKVRKLEVKKIMSDEKIKELEGELFTDRKFNHIIDENCDVFYREGGKKIILAISQSMRERCMHVAMMGTQQCFLVRQFILKSIMILLEPFI